MANENPLASTLTSSFGSIFGTLAGTMLAIAIAGVFAVVVLIGSCVACSAFTASVLDEIESADTVAAGDP